MKIPNYYSYERLPKNQAKDCLNLDLSMSIKNPTVGSVVKEKTNNLGKTNSHTGRKFKLVKIQKQRFEDQDLMKYKTNCFYIRCYCNYSEIIHRELWVLTNEDNK